MSQFLDWIEPHKDKLDWHYLSMNTHPAAIEMLEQNFNKIGWV
jgi:hypothetical protein